jgi:hypothetical protein
MIRTSEVKVQVDRWPLARKQEHLLTVIVVCTYKSKPDVGAIQQALRDAVEILAKQE